VGWPAHGALVGDTVPGMSLRVTAALTAVLVAASVGVAVAEEPAAPASATAIRAYHDSGEWAKDFATQFKLASKDLDKALTVKKGKKKPKGTPTLILDIDDTSLSSYDCAAKKDFIPGSNGICAVTENLPAIKGALDLAKKAVKKKVKLVFITARPENETIRAFTEKNLKVAGYTMKHALTMKPSGIAAETSAAYKTAARKALIKGGARIVLNVGDQQSDLSGGAAQYAVKLPNPMYVNK